MSEGLRFIWCFLFHGRYRKRTGQRQILKVSIWYETKCEKCGREDIDDVEWVF